MCEHIFDLLKHGWHLEFSFQKTQNKHLSDGLTILVFVYGCSKFTYLQFAFEYGNAFLFCRHGYWPGELWEKWIYECCSICRIFDGWIYMLYPVLVTLGSSVTYAWTGEGGLRRVQFLRQLEAPVVITRCSPVSSSILQLHCVQYPSLMPQKVDCFEASWLASASQIYQVWGRFFLSRFGTFSVFSALSLKKFGNIIVISTAVLGFGRWWLDLVLLLQHQTFVWSFFHILEAGISNMAVL